MSGDYIAYRLCGEMALRLFHGLADHHVRPAQPDVARRLLGPWAWTTWFPVPGSLDAARPGWTGAAAAAGLNVGLPVVLGGADFACGAYAAGSSMQETQPIVTGTWEIVVVCSDRPQLGPSMKVRSHLRRCMLPWGAGPFESRTLRRCDGMVSQAGQSAVARRGVRRGRHGLATVDRARLRLRMPAATA